MNKKRIIIICICVVLVLAAGITLYLLLSDKKQEEEPTVIVYSEYEYVVNQENEDVKIVLSKNNKDYSWKCETGNEKQIKVKKISEEQTDSFILSCDKVLIDNPVFILSDGENDIYKIETDFLSTGKDSCDLVVKSCQKVINDASYLEDSKIPFSTNTKEKGAIEITVERKSDTYLYTECDEGVSMSVLRSDEKFFTYIVRVSQTGDKKIWISDDSKKVNATLEIVLSVEEDLSVSVKSFECKDFVASEEYSAQQELNNSATVREGQQQPPETTEKTKKNKKGKT